MIYWWFYFAKVIEAFYIFIDYKDTHFAVVLDFIGGEPFLEPELIDKATDYWFYKCIKHRKEVPWYLYSRFSICSNGTEWDDPRVQKLMNKIGTTTSFTVSIDGNKELHDSARVHLDGVTGSYDEAIHAAEDATDEFEVSENYYDDVELPTDGIDRSYSVKAVYDDCESEYAMTADGQASVRLVNMGVNEMDNAFRVYPNPTDGQIVVETEAAQVAIYNVMGQIVEEKDTENGVAVFDLGRLSNGFYFIKKIFHKFKIFSIYF